MNPRLFLINPAQEYVNYYAQTELGRLLGKKKFMVPLALPVIASLTPAHYSIRIIDDQTEEIDFNDLPDIVGITTLSSTITRAYYISDEYRKRGVKVVMGGAYASFMTDEVLNHCDAVVSGEAENVWENLLSDFESGSLKKVYRSESLCSYSSQPLPRWDLFNTDDIFQLGVQVSRGCPYNCEFCVATKIFGHKMRYRDVEDVVKELKLLPLKRIFFIDDNFTINRKYIRALLPHLKKLNISWACMASIDIAQETELLKEMSASGCFNILIGFESLNPGSLNETNKKHNRNGTFYIDAVSNIHRAGIHVTASFAVGFDHDTSEEFERIYSFTLQTGLSYINLNLLGAPPGSELYKRLSGQGRCPDIKPDFRSGLFPSIRYNHFSQIEIFDHYLDTIKKIYSFQAMEKKVSVLFGNGDFTLPYLGPGFSIAFRLRTVMTIMGSYVFSFSLPRFRMFRKIVSLMIKRKLAADKGFSYLLSMLSYHRHIMRIYRNREMYRAIIMTYNTDSWNNGINIAMSNFDNRDNVSEDGSLNLIHKTETS